MFTWVPFLALTQQFLINHYCLFPVSVNSEVSNEVEVTPGVLSRALRAAAVGPCYTNYLKMVLVADLLVLQGNWIITIALPICL